MDVGGDRLAVARLEPRGAADEDVLADLADQLLALVLERFDGVRPVLLDRVEHLLGERAELVVLRDGLGLGADRDDRALRVVEAREDDALGRLVAGALAGRGHAPLAQELLRGVEVAVGVLERALGVHHRRAGHLAQLPDEVCRDLGHSAGTSSAVARAGSSAAAERSSRSGALLSAAR